MSVPHLKPTHARTHATHSTDNQDLGSRTLLTLLWLLICLSARNESGVLIAERVDVLTLDGDSERPLHERGPVDVARQESKVAHDALELLFQKLGLKLLENGQRDTEDNLPTLGDEDVPHADHDLEWEGAREDSHEPLRAEEGHVNIGLPKVRVQARQVDPQQRAQHRVAAAHGAAAGREEAPHVVLWGHHHTRQHPKRILFRHVGQKQGCEEVDALEVARVGVQHRVGHEHVAQRLPPPRGRCQQLHAGEGAVQVAVDDAPRPDLLRGVRMGACGVQQVAVGAVRCALRSRHVC
mmetsp:Transcript_14901/g.47497  ORF Transcript_14901/g.47497 Transcript_14901/m.47497 type:complete len:295 (-) Transcript_14901:352-1236(-)